MGKAPQLRRKHPSLLWVLVPPWGRWGPRVACRETPAGLEETARGEESPGPVLCLGGSLTLAKGSVTFPRCRIPGVGCPHTGILWSEMLSMGRGPRRCVLGRASPCPVTSKDRDLRFLLFASNDSSRFLPKLFFWPRSQGPGSSPRCSTTWDGASPVLLDRLSSLVACCSVGLGGRLQASRPSGRESSASLRECRDRLLRSMEGASRWRPSVPRALERLPAAFTEMHLVPVRISFFSLWDKGISDRFSLLSGEELTRLLRLS